jgi:hypothetical protein
MKQIIAKYSIDRHITAKMPTDPDRELHLLFAGSNTDNIA